MKKIVLGAILVFILISCRHEVSRPDFVLVIHGGAGYGKKSDLSPEREKQYIDKLTEVLETGAGLLEKGGSSLDAVEACIRIMEDSPLFNAGKGAVFNECGENEMDASIMDGKSLDAGAVAGVSSIRNPISAARMVMEHSKHVMLSGQGAEIFASDQGLEIVDSSYFFTERRWNSFQRAKKKAEEAAKQKYSTVGAVALDKAGNLAAGTSTGGITYKMKGRVGDSPVIGAGTYANNKTCAVSATGHGEYFIRNVVAYDISARMEYAEQSLQEASDKLILQKLTQINASGGIIAVDKNGNIAMPFNTESMIRGYITSSGEMQIVIY
ncbi:MAG: isoaspartyl peptidase/L-asparaginase [Bacteroidota bacterium]|nr:isoaspartyl peptidase/L-asparaginase [Bacteroidota bacterium]